MDEFATMFETLFAGTPETPLQPNHLTEDPWTWQQLMGAIKKSKFNLFLDKTQAANIPVWILSLDL